MNQSLEKAVDMMLNKNQFMQPEDSDGLLEFFSSLSLLIRDKNFFKSEVL